MDSRINESSIFYITSFNGGYFEMIIIVPNYNHLMKQMRF